MEETNQTKMWFKFMALNEWKIFMNLVRILTFILIVFLIIYIIKEVETFKAMANACDYCMAKSGCECFCLN